MDNIKLEVDPVNDYPPKMEVRIQSWDSIDQQLASPIFRLPAELRDAIFNLALADEVSPHPDCSKYDLQVLHGKDAVPRDPQPDNNNNNNNNNNTMIIDPNPRQQIPPAMGWLHPDISGPSYIPGIRLLSTCRRIYLETRDLPIRNKQIQAFKHWPGSTFPPWVEPYDDSGSTPSGADGLLAEHFVGGRQVRSLRVFGSAEHLDKSFPEEIVNLDNDSCETLEKLHTLHLTMRSSTWAAIDWPQQESSIDPYNWLYKKACLADALLLMPNLKKLTIDFETGITNWENMEQYFETYNAKDWKFLVLQNPPARVIKTEDGQDLYWRPRGGSKIPAGAKRTRAYFMVDPIACHEADGHTPDDHPLAPRLADLKGANGEPVKYGWLTLDLKKKDAPIEEIAEIRSYQSPLPGDWAGLTFLRQMRVLFATFGQQPHTQRADLGTLDDRYSRMVSYRLTWKFRPAVPGEEVAAALWCCDAKEGEEYESPEGGSDDDDDDVGGPAPRFLDEYGHMV